MAKVVAIKFHPSGGGQEDVLLLFKNPPSREEVLAALAAREQTRGVELARRSIQVYGWEKPTLEQMRKEGSTLQIWRHTEADIPAGWTKCQLLDIVYNDKPADKTQPWRLHKTHK